MHSLLSKWLPEHILPPFWGTGSTQARLRLVNPILPHAAVQTSQGDQMDQFPSTKNKSTNLVTMIYKRIRELNAPIIIERKKFMGFIFTDHLRLTLSSEQNGDTGDFFINIG